MLMVKLSRFFLPFSSFHIRRIVYTFDNFNRADGPIGSNWTVSNAYYQITNQHLAVRNSNTEVYWNATRYGSDQEAYRSLNTVDPNGIENDLILKVQTEGNTLTGCIEVFYNPREHTVEVWTYDIGYTGWVNLGASMRGADAGEWGPTGSARAGERAGQGVRQRDAGAERGRERLGARQRRRVYWDDLHRVTQRGGG
jgi:hypothetical protein